MTATLTRPVAAPPARRCLGPHRWLVRWLLGRAPSHDEARPTRPGPVWLASCSAVLVGTLLGVATGDRSAR